MTTLTQQEADFIVALADEDGHIDPRVVVERARDPKSPIHRHFEWDRDKAAAAYLIDQACALTRLVKIEFVYEDRTYQSVRYVRDPDEPLKSKRYIDLTIAQSKRAKSQKILLAEIDRIIAGIKRAIPIAHVLNLQQQFQQVLVEGPTKPPRGGARRRKGGTSETRIGA